MLSLLTIRFLKKTRRTEGSRLTRRFLKALVPYLKQVAGLLLIGSIGGLVMNTAVVLPAILLGARLTWQQPGGKAMPPAATYCGLGWPMSVQ